MRNSLINILIFITTASALAQSYGYKNDTIGESTASFIANNTTLNRKGKPVKPGCSNGHPNTTNHFCTTIDGLHEYQFINDTLVTITGTFDQSQYAAMLDGITAKYGAPASNTTRGYVTGTGNQFNGQVATWHLPGVTIVLSEWADRAPVSYNLGNFVISDDTYVAQQAPHVTF
jgi:hypothetical protein